MKLVAILSLFSCLAIAQEPSADEMAMMQKMMELATPGPEHTLISKMAGTWSIEGRWRMTPVEPWQTSQSKCENTMILGGRFLKTEVSGQMWGMPFNGFGIMGFDKDLKSFFSTWCDNFGTMMLVSKGSGDLEKSTIDLISEYKDPMSGQNTKMRSVYHVKSENEVVLSMYGYNPEGEEWLTMVLTYTK